MITFIPSYTGKTIFLSYPVCLYLWWESMTGVQIECMGWLWRPVFCPRVVRFKMFLPLTSVKKKLCTLPPDSLSWRRGFSLIFLPLLIDKQRIHNPKFKDQILSLKIMKVSSKSNQWGSLHIDNCLIQWVSVCFTLSSMNPQAKDAPSTPLLSLPANPHLSRTQDHSPSSLPLWKARTWEHKAYLISITWPAPSHHDETISWLPEPG